LLAQPDLGLNRLDGALACCDVGGGKLHGKTQLVKPVGERGLLGVDGRQLARGVLTARLQLAQPLLRNRQVATDAFSLAVQVAALGVEGGKLGAAFGLLLAQARRCRRPVRQAVAGA
jgi:hypothetical protein